MSNFIGIDLGTTNSAICAYDGSETRVQKTPRERNDVTPSVIYFDRRGGRHVGHRAYDTAPLHPTSCAMLFKRRMGEDTLIEMPGANRTLTPEECSAEILKELFSYLSEEIRNAPETGTVVTVPAAFSQKARQATMKAAETAGIGKVELMQEPVAAVMSFMRVNDTDGTFLIYDLGGGTFDVAIAQSTGGKVNLLAHGGVEMCGGRDFDRLIVEHVLLTRMHEEYDLPAEIAKDKAFGKLSRVLTYSAEQAKKELASSDQDEITIQIPHITVDDDTLQDLNGKPIYEEIPLQRATFDKLIAEKIEDTVNCSKKTMEECGVNASDIERIVWVGGPTHYKPLRDTVSAALGIGGDLSVDPMTAVAEGASLFAESVDWRSEDRRQKSTRGEVASDELAVSFNYTARTSRDTSKIVVQVKGEVPAGAEFEINNLDSGTTSGRLPLTHGAVVDVTLTKPGENTFEIVAQDSQGKRIAIAQNEIVIMKTAAIIDAIPAPSTISLAVLDKPGGRPIPERLISKGDALPKKGTLSLKSNAQLAAGATESINFTLWEGEIKEDLLANLHAGEFKIAGTDFEEGVITVGANLTFNYEIQTSGLIKLEVEVPDIRGIFESPELDPYSRGESGLDAEKVIDEGQKARNRINQIREVVTGDEKLDRAQQKLETSNALDSDESDPEKIKEAEQSVNQANELLDEVIRKNRKQIRQGDLDREVTYFDKYCRQHTKPAEEEAYDSLAETAQRSIENDDNDFDEHIRQLSGRVFEVLWRQPWFVIANFKQIATSYRVAPADRFRFESLVEEGIQLLGTPIIRSYENRSDEDKYGGAFMDDGTIERLREIIREILSIPPVGGSEVTPTDILINVTKG